MLSALRPSSGDFALTDKGFDPRDLATDFLDFGDILDWGCGCGRVTVHYLGLRQSPEVFGCDIDSEAITWCQQELRPGVFVPINPWPPTPYESSSFDLVIGYSIFTHLTQETQAAWLEEMRRIIRPGGLFLASTHGDFTASFSNSPSLAGLSQSGIVDGELDPRLDGVAPEGYYRTVYQTRSYTTREWSKYFEVLEYIERGVGNYQDLIVMRRRSES